MGMKKSVLVSILVVLSVSTCGLYFYLQENIPSSKTPSYTKLFADGLYEVRSFPDSNPLCGYDEVVEVNTNKMIYQSRMCEANIVEIQVKEDKVVIFKSSMMGKEEIVVAR